MSNPELTWGSHLPALLAAVAETTGPVLELGIGYFSTPHLHALCTAQRRWLVSVEDNPEWYQLFARYESNLHSLRLVDYRNALVEMSAKRWSVVFVDHSPGGKNRGNAFSAFINCSELVLVHDYHLENEDAIKPLLIGVAHCVITAFQPPTLVASKSRDIPDSIINLNGSL